MKKTLLVLLMLLVLIVPFSSALQPTDEVVCCQSFERGITDLPVECQQYELTQENCKEVISGWESTVFWMTYGDIIVILLFIAVLVGAFWLIRKLIKKKK